MDLSVTQHRIGHDGTLTLDLQVKLNGGIILDDTKHLQILWVGNGILAVSMGNQAIKIWDMLNDENQNLTLPDTEGTVVTFMSYNWNRHVLACKILLPHPPTHLSTSPILFFILILIFSLILTLPISPLPKPIL